MKRWLLASLLMLAATGGVFICVIVRGASKPDGRAAEPTADGGQHAGNSHQALRKAAEFLQPDTKSDIRFGRAKSSTQATPAPGTSR